MTNYRTTPMFLIALLLVTGARTASAGELSMEDAKTVAAYPLTMDKVGFTTLRLNKTVRAPKNTSIGPTWNSKFPKAFWLNRMAIILSLFSEKDYF